MRLTWAISRTSESLRTGAERASPPPCSPLWTNGQCRSASRPSTCGRINETSRRCGSSRITTTGAPDCESPTRPLRTSRGESTCRRDWGHLGVPVTRTADWMWTSERNSGTVEESHPDSLPLREGAGHQRVCHQTPQTQFGCPTGRRGRRQGERARLTGDTKGRAHDAYGYGAWRASVQAERRSHVWQRSLRREGRDGGDDSRR